MSEKKNETILAIKVVTRASRNEIVGFSADGLLRVRVTAPPVEGAANKAVIKLLAEALGVAKSNLEIIAGHTSTEKRVRVSKLASREVGERLKMYLTT
jgi:hypothetical protein